MGATLKQYHHAFYISQLFADLLEVDEYPLDVFEVCLHKEGAPVLVSSFTEYKQWAKNANKKCPNELKDAKCYFQPESGIHIIIYNEKMPINRIRFSIAHEIGHIVLGHLKNEITEIDRGGLDDITYYAMEGEANTFAGNFLAPPILIHERIGGGKFDIDDIASFFKMSIDAVKNYRKQDYSHWLKTSPSKHEKNILTRCLKSLFPNVCKNCNNTSYGKANNFCPICGEKTNFEHNNKELKSMKYSGISIDEKGRALECPFCHNTELSEDGQYCIICGKKIINQCSTATEDLPFPSDCTKILPGNARYCPSCGAKSYFFEMGILTPWNDSKEKQTQKIDVNEFEELPF